MLVVSKASFKSSKIPQAKFLRLKAFPVSSLIAERACVAEWTYVKPNCFSYSIFLTLKNVIKRLSMSNSITLLTLESNEIGR